MAKTQYLITCVFLVTIFSINSYSEAFVYRSKPKVSYSGKLIFKEYNRNEVGIRSSNYSYRVVPKTKRQIGGISVYDIDIVKDGATIYSVNNVYNIPQISDSGTLIAQKSPSKIGLMPSLELYDNKGSLKISKKYSNPVELYGFNQNESYYGVGTIEGIDIIDCNNGNINKYNIGYNYAVSDNGLYVIVASKEDERSIITVYKNKKNIGSVKFSKLAIRKLDISPDNQFIGVIDRDNFSLIKLSDLSVLKKNSLDKKDNVSFVDLMFGSSNIWVGQQERNIDHSRFEGVLKVYNLQGNVISTERGIVREKKRKKIDRKLEENEYPWPFEPQNRSHTVWNGYLAITGSSNSSSGAYLHQGLDIDVPANEPTVSVSDGFCKARLYIMDPSYLYWRVCVADEDVSIRTNGWMYAHLVENTITVHPDDEVFTGQILGEIIKWDALSSGWDERGHIHFSRISDHGNQWSYTDDQWRNVCDPLSLLRPFGDTIPPQFINTDNGTPFKFSTNEGAGYLRYLQANNLEGEIDVIVKMTDHVGDSKWLQPASKIFWWIKSDFDNKIVHPRTIGLIRNQTMPDYTGSLYSSILPPVMHRMDYECGMYSSWTTANRTYHHIITNNDGDSTVEEFDKYEALDTRNFGDGDYWILVELQDAAGNIAVDSQLVTFNNGIVNVAENNIILNNNTRIKQTSQNITFYRSKPEFQIKIFNLKGAVIFNDFSKEMEYPLNRSKIGKGHYIVKFIDNDMVEQQTITIY